MMKTSKIFAPMRSQGKNRFGLAGATSVIALAIMDPAVALAQNTAVQAPIQDPATAPQATPVQDPTTAPQAAVGSEPTQTEEAQQDIVVTGLRGSLQRNLDIKRTSSGIVDAISAEDIGKFPDSNVAASLQRLPGVSIQRSGGHRHHRARLQRRLQHHAI
jgi:iron complex outermembrane receptor protein